MWLGACLNQEEACFGTRMDKSSLIRFLLHKELAHARGGDTDPMSLQWQANGIGPLYSSQFSLTVFKYTYPDDSLLFVILRINALLG